MMDYGFGLAVVGVTVGLAGITIGLAMLTAWAMDNHPRIAAGIVIAILIVAIFFLASWAGKA